MVKDWKDLTLKEKKIIANARLEERLGELNIPKISDFKREFLAGHYMAALEHNCYYGFMDHAKKALDFLVPYCQDTGNDKMLSRVRELYEKSFGG